jgi:hypothetical protein
MEKSMNAREKAVLCFTKTTGLSHRAATHTAQKNYQETLEESRYFTAMMKDKVTDKDPSDIINTDQTPIPFSFHSMKTFKKRAQEPSMWVPLQLTGRE